MKVLETNSRLSASTLEHASELFAAHRQTIYESTDRMFAVLMSIQWIAGVIAALWIAPRTWIGTTSQTHIHVWAALFLGAAISCFPIGLAIVRPGATTTRYVIAAAQMMTSALLIHLTGGRIETHFHVFGSLAFLAFYRDWRVLVPATIVVAADHFLRGVFWPQSVYGVLSVSQWRWLEHAGWVLFEDTFLFIAIKRSVGEMWGMALRTAELNDNEERYRAVVEQTAEGLVLADVGTKRVLECNVAFADLLGYTLEEALTLTAYDFVVDEREAIDRRSGSLLDRRLPITGEQRFRRKDDSIIDVEVNVSVIAYGGKDVFCTIVRDIGERKRAEEALRKAHEELETRVRERTAELAAANEGLQREVDERKLADDALRDSEERYRLMFDSNPLPLWVYDLETLSFLAVNNAAVQGYGYSSEEFLAMTIIDIRPPEDVPALLDTVARLSDGLDNTGKWRHRKKDGSIIDVEIASHTLDFTGRRARIVLAVDITERARAEKALQESQQWLAAVYDSSRDGIIVEESERVVYVNQSYAHLFGYKIDELIGQPAWLVSEQEPSQRMLEYSRRRVRGEEAPSLYEFRGTRKDGTTVDLEASVSTAKIGGKTYIIAAARDITERKRAQEKIAQLAEIVASSHDGMLRASADGIIVNWNKGTERIFGYSAEEIVGSPLSLLVPDDRKDEFSEIFERLKKGESIDHYETKRLRKDGTLIDVSLTLSPVTDSSGELTAMSAIIRDITERKRAESEILLQKARFQQLFENAPLGILRVDQNDLVVDANKEFEAIFQFSLNEIRGRNINEMVVPKAHREEGTALSSRALQGEIIDQETVRQRKDGTLIPVHIYGLPIVVNQEPVGVFAIYVDLSERKLAEEEVARKTHELSEFVEHATVGIHWVGPDGIIQLVNRAELELLGYTREEVIGHHIAEFHADQPVIQDILDRLSRGEAIQEYAARLRRKDGLIKDVLIDSSVLREDGKLVHTRCFTRDITERKRMEQEREVIFEIIQGAISTSDLGDLFKLIHKSISSLLYAENCFVALHDPKTDLMHFEFWVDKLDPCPPPLPMGVGFGSYVLRTGQSLLLDRELTERMYQSGEVEKSGSASASWLGVPLRTPTRTIGVLVVQHYEEEKAYGQRDLEFLTSVGSQIALAIERRRAETNLRETEDQLRQSQKMEGIGTLAGGIAHDFNNLMTAVTGYSELALRSLEADNPVRSKIEEIKKAGERAAALTSQLLAFSRKQILQPRVLDLNTVVTGMGRMLPRIIGEDIDLRIELGGSLGQIKADPGQIEQILMNLAVNARDAMAEGGRLTIKTENVQMDGKFAKRRSVVEPGRYVMLSVSDNGCGMDAETRTHIFEPFFTTKEVGKGTGLGLSTVYGIVKQSGGGVWVYSEVGRGTTFKIYLPRVDEVVETEKSFDKVRPVLRGHETVLLAEDEDMVRDLCKEILEAYGYAVIVASNGKEGLRVCQEFQGRIDLLITDVIMPQMSGRELAEGVTALRPDTRVLYMSGFTDDAVVRHGVLDDGVFFIQKPFSPDALVLKAREVLDHGGSSPADGAALIPPQNPMKHSETIRRN